MHNITKGDPYSEPYSNTLIAQLSLGCMHLGTGFLWSLVLKCIHPKFNCALTYAFEHDSEYFVS